MSGFEFLFYTDVHIQPERRAPQGFAQAINAMRATAPDAEFAVCGGDLVLDANAVPYECASALFDLYLAQARRLNVPIYHAFGNHDFFGLNATRSGANPGGPHWGRQLFLEKLGQAQTYYSFNYGGWHFVVLDTNDFPSGRSWRGFVDEAQRDWLRDDLQRAGDAPTVLVAHIPLLTAFGQVSDQASDAPESLMVIGNSKEITDLIRPFHVKAVLQAHTHIVEEIDYLGTRYLSAGSICGDWWKGPRLGLHPEGFAVCTCGTDGTFGYRYVPYGWAAQETHSEAP